MTATVHPFPRTAPELAERRYRASLAELQRLFPETAWPLVAETLTAYGTFIANLHDGERGAA